MTSIDKNNQLCEVCSHCKQVTVNVTSSLSDECSDNEKCAKWLEKCSITDTGSDISECVSEYTECSSRKDDIESECIVSNKVFNSNNNSEIDDLNIFPDVKHSYRNVKIVKSNNVHLGNITYINGPVYVNQSASIVNQQTTINQFILKDSSDQPKPKIVDRTNWLAQPPLEEREYLESPAKYVIIAHSASEEKYTQSENILLVRLIQQFHIESRKWNDIAYNFLIGADGNIYEGRGWGVVGSHTFSYNKHCIGIAFVGCYMNKLPPKVSLHQAKQLIEYGVKIGAIDENYQLLGHCQCSPTESPGGRLYQEIKTWKNWNPDISCLNPSPVTNLVV